MQREMGIFPYNNDNVMIANPDTDGTISSVPTGRETDITGPQNRPLTPKNRGAIIKGTIGNTDLVGANTTHHTVFTGSF